MKLGKVDLGWRETKQNTEQFATKEALYKAMHEAVIARGGKLKADFPAALFPKLQTTVEEAMAAMEQLAVNFTHDDPRSNLTGKMLRTPTNTYDDVYAIFLKRLEACCGSLPDTPDKAVALFEPRITIEGVDAGAEDVTVMKIARMMWEEVMTTLSKNKDQ